MVLVFCGCHETAKAAKLFLDIVDTVYHIHGLLGGDFSLVV